MRLVETFGEAGAGEKAVVIQNTLRTKTFANSAKISTRFTSSGVLVGADLYYYYSMTLYDLLDILSRLAPERKYNSN